MKRKCSDTNHAGLRYLGSAALVALLGIAAAVSMILAPVRAQAAGPTPYVYVTNSNAGSVYVVDTSTNTVAAKVSVVGAPEGVAVTPDGAFAYVVNSIAEQGDVGISVIKTSTSTVVAGIRVGRSPREVAITPDGAFAYVTNLGSDNVSVISTATNTVVATVPVGTFPDGIAITPDGAFAYVTNAFPNPSLGESVSVIDTATNTVVATIPLGERPGGVAIAPDGSLAYVGIEDGTGGSSLAVIKTSTNKIDTTIPVGAYPSAPGEVAITPDGAFAYVTNFFGGLALVSTATNSLVSTLPVGASTDVAITRDGTIAYVAAGYGGLVALNTSTNAVLATVPVNGATDIAITPPIVLAGSAPGTGDGVTPPKVRITGHPPRETARAEGTFTFAGVAGGTYECAVDARAWAPCASGQTFGPLAPGDHLFQVRETLAGLTGPAASYRWTIDLPRACVLRVARARVFLYTTKRLARLVIHYTSYRPADVAVSYKMAGAGALSLGSTATHFGRAGVFRLPVSLSAEKIAQLRAAKLFKVHFAIPRTPGSCGRLYTKRLTIPKKFSGQTVWFQSDSIFAR